MTSNSSTDLRLIGPFSQVVTLAELPVKGAIADEELHIQVNAGVLISELTGDILEVHDFEELRKTYPHATLELQETPGVLIPGFIDVHTHICFSGSRARDYAMRVAGKSYLEIANAGGGIWDSVTQTRAASEEELAELTRDRANRLLATGTTTIEVKSGYGLNFENEIKMLRAIQSAANLTTADLISTCLAAHTKPRDFEGTSSEYLQEMLAKLLPEVRRQNLSNRVDIFIEQSAFGLEESKSYLEQAKQLGFEITVHADQFSTGGSAVAVELGAISADHLESSTDVEIEILAKSDTVAVALPGASIGLGMAFTPGRKLLDAGACLAIGSDWNPGSAPMGDLLTQAAIYGAFEKLSIAETLAGMTFRAAKALGLSDRGRLKAGQLADFQSYATTDYRDIFYQQGSLKPSQVWKRGIRI